MFRLALPTAAMIAALATPTLALDVTKTATVAAAPETVWKTIGGFCGIGDWHPVIEACALTKGDAKAHRTLTLKGGGTIVEEEQSRDDKAMAYTYTILSGPLPVQNYTSKIGVEKDGQGSKVTWTGTFEAKGASDEEAKKAIGGVYEAGLKGIADKAK